MGGESPTDVLFLLICFVALQWPVAVVDAVVRDENPASVTAEPLECPDGGGDVATTIGISAMPTSRKWRQVKPPRSTRKCRRLRTERRTGWEVEEFRAERKLEVGREANGSRQMKLQAIGFLF